MTREPKAPLDDSFPFPFQILSDEDEEVWRHLSAAEGYAELGMYAEAHRELDLAESREGFRFEVAARKLDVFLAEKRWADAAIYGEIMTEFFPDEPAHFMKFATALHGLGKTDFAIYTLSLAPPELERDPDYQFRLAGYEFEAGTREDALFHLENAIALQPELRQTARHDPQLKQIVDQIPDEPRFIPTEWPYGEEEDEPDDEDLEADPFGKTFGDSSGAFSEPDDEDFDCPF